MPVKVCLSKITMSQSLFDFSLCSISGAAKQLPSFPTFMQMLAQYVKPMFEQLQQLTNNNQQVHTLPTSLPPLLPPTEAPASEQVESGSNDVQQDDQSDEDGDDIQSVEDVEVTLLPWQKEQQQEWFRLKEEAEMKREMGIGETQVKPSIDVVPMHDEVENEDDEASNSEQEGESEGNNQDDNKRKPQVPGDVPHSPVTSASNPIQQLQQQTLVAGSSQQQFQQSVVQRPPLVSPNVISQSGPAAEIPQQQSMIHAVPQPSMESAQQHPMGQNQPQQQAMLHQRPAAANSQQKPMGHIMPQQPPHGNTPQQPPVGQQRLQQKPNSDMPQQSQVQQPPQTQQHKVTGLSHQQMEAKRQYQRHYQRHFYNHMRRKFQRPSHTGYSLHKLHDPRKPGVISHDTLYQYNHMKQINKQQPSKQPVVCIPLSVLIFY